MNVKQCTLKVLENHKGQYISGQELAQQLSVSRNSVWKSVKSLREEGYEISAVPNKGYCLANSSDILSSQGIKKHLAEYSDNFDIIVYKTITSTNSVAKELASKGAKEGTVIISEEQTQGRGRLGRNFYSPQKTGIYMSLILRPELNASESLFITTSAAVAVARAIESVSDKDVKIKWVNDVFCNDKKVCGILTEASFGLESGGIEFVVLGIGINVKPPQDGFPSKIEEIATSVFENDISADIRSELIAEVLKNFLQYYKKLPSKDFISDYKARSLLIGRKISVISGDSAQNATAIDIDDDCKLKVEFDDGTQKLLSSGEVSIRI
ncbi:MAG: biotin--[acetyl-CoA-carboxylase] ligase [Oscillospiraceae bacterium]